MITLDKINNSDPYDVFKIFYDKDNLKNQKSIEAIAVSSFNTESNEVESRYVNLKYICDDRWIFFTNYNSQKSQDFEKHNQISVLFYWQSTNVQIRLKAKIKKCSKEFSDLHFKNRSDSKNALAISSNQSEPIASYNEIVNNFKNTYNNKSLLSNRPESWGGFEFTPYYFEFWEGHDSRLNKRQIFSIKDNSWSSFILQP